MIAVARQGWSALVTGGARGIGEAVVRRLFAAGASVAILDRDTEAAERLAGQLNDDLTRQLDAQPESADQEALALPTDVCDSGQIDQAVRQTVAAFGGLDAVVNNAGVNARFDPVAMTEQDWDAFFAVDLKASWLICRATLPVLERSPRGAVVNISSIHARLTGPGVFPYPAAKAAIEGLTRSLAMDYGSRGVRVNAVAPGWTRTALVEEWMALQDDPAGALAAVVDSHPLGRMAEPADIAAAVAFLLDPSARAITGSVLAVDCGLSARAAF